MPWYTPEEGSRVEVVWLDAVGGDDGWKPMEEYRDIHLATCNTMGYVAEVADDAITVVMNVNELGHAASYMTIPRSWITEIRVWS